MEDKSKEQEIIKRYGEISKKVLEIDKKDVNKISKSSKSNFVQNN